MAKINLVASAGIIGLCLVCGGAAAHATVTSFPGLGTNTLGPEFLLTVGPGGATSFTYNPVYTVDPGVYDGSDDTYVGVVNHSGGTISTITLTSSTTIFGFDGDGISNNQYGAPGNSIDTTQYGGPDGYFTNITSGYDSNSNFFETGDVNFIGGIVNGGIDYFALEEQLTTASVTPTDPVISGAPEPSAWALMMAGVFGIGLALRRDGKNDRRAPAAA